MQLQDWVSPGVIVTGVGVIVALIAWLGTKNIKRIVYGTPPPITLFRVHDSVSGRLKATFDGKDITELHLHNIQFVNNGTRAVLVQDYASPITVSFIEEAKIVAYSVTSVAPNDLEIPVIWSISNIISLPPLLLNPKDSFYLHIWANTKKEPTIKGRLVEGNITWSLNPSKKGLVREILELLPVFIVYLVGSYLGKKYFESNWSVAAYSGMFFFTVIGYEIWKARR